MYICIHMYTYLRTDSYVYVLCSPSPPREPKRSTQLLQLNSICMYACKDSAAPAHARTRVTRTQARGATPELRRVI